MARTFAWTLRQASRIDVAHQHGRAAGRRLLVVGHDRGVAHDDGDPVERHAELLGRDLGEDRPRALAHVRRAGVDDDAAVGQQPDRRVREAGRRPRLEPDRDPATPTRASAGRPSRSSRPLARRCVAQSPSAGVSPGMKASPWLGEVLQAQLDRVDAQHARRLVHVRLDRPDLLRVAEAAEGGRGHGVREDAPGDDPDRRRQRTARSPCSCPWPPSGRRCRRRRRSGSSPRCRGTRRRAVRPEAGPDVDLRCAAADGLERLLERQDEPDRAGPSGGP